MCGRYAFAQGIEELTAAFNARAVDVGDWVPKSSVNITSRPPVLFEQLDDSGEIERLVTRAMWRFVPQNPEDRRKAPLINARLDKLQLWSGWRDSYIDSRIAIPMSGYYEFLERRIDGKKAKQPVFIHDPSRPILMAAGLYSMTADEENKPLMSFTIITTEGKDAASEVHDRMPVFLPEDAIDGWIQPGEWDQKTRKARKDRLQDFAATMAKNLETYPVSRELNNVKTIDVADLSLMDETELLGEPIDS